MKHEFEKNMGIISDLLAYCHVRGAREYHVDIEFPKGFAHYTIQAHIADMTEDEIDELSDILNAPRQREIEHNYWGLSGDFDTAPEITLIGMMIDSAELTYENGMLTIDIIRYKSAK